MRCDTFARQQQNAQEETQTRRQNRSKRMSLWLSGRIVVVEKSRIGFRIKRPLEVGEERLSFCFQPCLFLVMRKPCIRSLRAGKKEEERKARVQVNTQVFSTVLTAGEKSQEQMHLGLEPCSIILHVQRHLSFTDPCCMVHVPLWRRSRVLIPLSRVCRQHCACIVFAWRT